MRNTCRSIDFTAFFQKITFRNPNYYKFIAKALARGYDVVKQDAKNKKRRRFLKCLILTKWILTLI